LDADFNDLNDDGNADLSVSNGDTVLDTQFGADISEGANSIQLNKPDPEAGIAVDYDGSDEINKVSFTSGASDITEEDSVAITNYGSSVDVGSDMDTVEADVPENKLQSQHAVGSVTTTDSGGSSYNLVEPQGTSSEVGVLDTEADTGNDLILVGGPEVNDLTEDLAGQGDSWTGDQYTEGEGLIQMVSDAFADGYDALVVAGQTAEDTRVAGDYLSQYDENREEIEGKSQAVIDSETGEIVEQ
ncbi:MAG: hypothetical protein BRC30_01015, partial [Nanohaloarchaea archaeon SW_7_46_7]